MIRDQLINNEQIKPNSKKIDKLKDCFPELFDVNGNFLMNRLEELLRTEKICVQKEGYELNFLGKSYSKYLTSTDTKTVITPDDEFNLKEENRESDNLYIIGDNLDAIKHLLRSYSGKIKSIYIDPPYNTGSDGFVYPDEFEFTKESLSNAVGIEEDEAERILNIVGKSTHSAWLTFMYPRLLLSRDLLSKDGVIFLSIDDNEQANLKLLCDDIFGEANFVGMILWKKKTNGNNMGFLPPVHDYIMCYARNIGDISDMGYELTPETLASVYSNPDNDERGPWTTMDLSANHKGPIFPITNSVTGESFMPPKGRYWVFNENEVKKRIDEGRIIFGKYGNARPVQKVFLSEKKLNKRRAESWWDDKGYNSDATAELSYLFNEPKMFTNPKPTKLIMNLLDISTDENSYVLDFFSGSAATADAVMKMNSRDKGHRKYILVQIPEKIKVSEPAYIAGYRTIDEIGRDRIKRAALKIKNETNAKIDYGFKIYHLNEPSQKTLDKIVDFNSYSTVIMDNMTEEFAFGGVPGSETILTTWMNQDGYGLTCQIKKIKLKTYIASMCKETLYIIDPGICSEDVMELIKLIEQDSLNISRIVLYPYSIAFNVFHELKKNLANLKNNKLINVIERF